MAAKISSKWSGFFTYMEQVISTEEWFERKRVPFIASLDIYANGSIKGTTTDDESKDLFDSPATIEGFTNDGFISFIVKYPHSYFEDENGIMQVEYGVDYPGCHYEGWLNEQGNKFTGEWTIRVSEQRKGLIGKEFEIFEVWGTWEMSLNP